MEKTFILFLDMLKQAVRNHSFEIKEDLTEKEWFDLFYLSCQHDVLPLIMNTVYRDTGLCRYEALRSEMMRSARKIAVFQAKKTGDFLLLYKQMNQSGLYPAVLKGIICRNMYETPELRFSLDEDILIPPHEIHRYHEFLLKHGFRMTDPDISLERADEVSYSHPETKLYLEVHKYLFPPPDPVYGDLNSLFEVFEEPVTVRICDTDIQTLGYTDHFLYLICHAYKHVIYSGIGIRQICDIGLFAEIYMKFIDWERIVSSCKEKNLDLFLSAVFRICTKYLGIDLSFLPISLQEVDESPLLEDILTGGTYGAADENRLHSATMTLRAITADKAGHKSYGLKKSLFPSKSYMMRSYPYLKKHGYLLPVAWAQRIYTYLKDSNKKTDPGKTIGIGKKRIELMKKYKIIGK